MRDILLVVLVYGLTTVGLSSSGHSPSSQQDAPRAPAPADPPVFRVGIDVIRVDAVVTDRQGRMVTDLTADDFEIRQGGELQEIVAARYVSVEAPPRPAGAPSPRPRQKDAPPTTPIPPAPGRAFANAAQVQRTIAIVVDDLGIAWENMEPTRRALRKFIDEEIHEGDLVALLRTGKSISALQQFTTDKRRLLTAADQLRWNGFSRRGIASFRALNNFLPTDSSFSFGAADPTALGQIDVLRQNMSAAGTLGAVTLTMQGLRDLPGRKAVVLISEGFSLLDRGEEGPGPVPFQPNNLVRPRLERLVDYALRTGVVLYTMDPRGLATGGMVAEDNVKTGDTGPDVEAGDRRRFLLETQDTLAFMAEQTGGLAMLNSNDLARNLKRISDDQRGYYVLGYTPPAGTFAKPGKTARYHRLSVRVKRDGVRVRTRKGFLGVADEDVPPPVLTTEQELYHAATSPFAATSLPLRATVLHGYRPGEGSFVRALLHVQGHELSFKRNAEGRDVATLDVMSLIFDESGAAVAGRSAPFEIERTAGVSESGGVVFAMTVPVEHPGGYQVRFAVRDQATGALGATGQFVEVANVRKGEFTLSGLVIGEERPDRRSVAMAADDTQAAAGGSTPILRVFDRGSRLVYACEIYNADAPVETRISVWRDGKPMFTAPPATLAPVDAEHKAPLPAGGGIRLGDRMPPGDYVFQMAARTRTKKGRGKPVAAVQWVEFTVR